MRVATKYGMGGRIVVEKIRECPICGVALTSLPGQWHHPPHPECILSNTVEAEKRWLHAKHMVSARIKKGEIDALEKVSSTIRRMDTLRQNSIREMEQTYDKENHR